MAGRTSSRRAAANTGSGVDVRGGAATHMGHRGRCTRRAHLRVRVQRATATADVRLRNMRGHRGPGRRCGGEAGCLLPAGYRLLRAGEGSVRVVHMRHPSLVGLRTANVGEAPLASYAWRDAGTCPSLGDGRARLRSAEAGEPIGRYLRREAGVRLPVTTPIGAAVIPGSSRVVARPIRAQHERHDGNVDDIDIVRQIDVAVAVKIFEILRRNPAAIAGPTHVAPDIAPETAMDVDA